MRCARGAGAAWLVVVSLCWGACGGAAGAGGARGGVSPLAARAQQFSVDSTLLAADAARRSPDTGYKLRAALSVAPVWSAPEPQHELLLKFNLHVPKLHLRGKHPKAEFLPHASVWDDYHDTPFYAHWKNGLIENIYLEPDEPTEFANYKKSLVSLFQFRILDGEYNETDISGHCNVLYESLSENVIRKFKRWCSWEGAHSSDAARSPTGDEALLVTRRLVRVELSPGGGGGLAALLAEDVASAGRGAGARGGVKLRAWHRLTARPDAAAPAPAPAATLRAALPARLQAQDLQLRPHPAAAAEPALELSAALGRSRAVLAAGEAAGGGGSAEAALALLELVPALRAASLRDLTRVLSSEGNQDILTGLMRALGAAGGAATHAAAAARLQLHSASPDAPADLQLLYLDALVPAEESVVVELLSLAEKRRGLADAALLAAARASRALPAASRATVRGTLTKELARCKDESCRVIRLRALGVLRDAAACGVLLQHAAGAEAAAAEEALLALGALAEEQPFALDRHRLQHLHDIVLALHRPATLEVRAAALDVLVRAGARQASARGLTLLPLRLGALAAALAAGPVELRRLLWHTLDELQADHPAVQTHASHVRADQPALYHHYYPGTSSVLSRLAGRGAGAAAGWAAGLRSRQVAAGGLLRSGEVTLWAGELAAGELAGAGAGRELLSLRVWARGLGALAGGGGEVSDAGAGQPEEEAGAGLVLGALGGRGIGTQLFSGQAALLAALWAGAGSEPTPVLRALPAPPPVQDTVPLCVGVSATRSWRAQLSLALDARVSVSLWSRTARAAVVLRAGGAALASCDVTSGWARAGAVSRAHAASRLRIHADLDFYEDVALCVRTHIDDAHYRDNVTLQATDGAGGAGLRRHRSVGVLQAGRSLALGADNDAACRRLQPQPDAEDD